MWIQIDVMGFCAMRRTTGICAALVVWLAPFAGEAAEFKVTDLDGIWEGIGTERASPMEPPQQVNCQSTNTTESSGMISEATCRGQAGLHKMSRLIVILKG